MKFSLRESEAYRATWGFRHITNYLNRALASLIKPRTKQLSVLGTGSARILAGLGSVFGQGPDYNPPIVNPQVVNQSNIYFAPFNLLNGPPVPVNPPVGSNGRYPLPDGIGIIYFADPAEFVPHSSRLQFWNFTVQQQLTHYARDSSCVCGQCRTAPLRNVSTAIRLFRARRRRPAPTFL